MLLLSPSIARNVNVRSRLESRGGRLGHEWKRNMAGKSCVYVLPLDLAAGSRYHYHTHYSTTQKRNSQQCTFPAWNHQLLASSWQRTLSCTQRVSLWPPAYVSWTRTSAQLRPARTPITIVIVGNGGHLFPKGASHVLKKDVPCTYGLMVLTKLLIRNSPISCICWKCWRDGSLQWTLLMMHPLSITHLVGTTLCVINRVASPWSIFIAL